LECCDAEVTIGPGDVLVMYSDGVTEAGRDSVEEFGEGRLLDAMRRTQGMPVDDILEGILCAVRDWLRGAPQEDDLTVVVMRGL
jgi:sigma-B regulation protein RsbU (phosphoserine phosphatase)